MRFYCTLIGPIGGLNYEVVKLYVVSSLTAIPQDRVHTYK